jgi:hypothetical protein
MGGLMTKEERRKAMPLASVFIDDLRENLGADQVVYIKASENGHEIEWGENQVVGNVEVIAQ